jgi:hypothetical protein
MPKPAPILTAGSREPRRPTRIPLAVKLACQFLVEGAPGDDGQPRSLGFAEAAKLAGVRPDAMRRWLHDPAVSALIKAKRAAFRQSICASNELALVSIRNGSGNDMAKVRAAIALEEMNVADAGPAPSEGHRFQVVVVNRLSQPTPVINARTIAAPYLAGEPEPEVEPEPEPVFVPRKW